MEEELSSSFASLLGGKLHYLASSVSVRVQKEDVGPILASRPRILNMYLCSLLKAIIPIILDVLEPFAR